MNVYSKTVGGVTEYAVVNRGTDSLAGWRENAQQPFGKSVAMQESIAKAQHFVNENPNAQITFIGHSKGGAEAAANAIATNRDAILFNPATAHLGAYGLPANAYTANMRGFIVEGEALDEVLRAIGMRGKVIDELTILDKSRIPRWLQQLNLMAPQNGLIRSLIAHSMEFLIATMAREGYAEQECE